MRRSEIEQVLANWISRAESSDGEFVEGVEPSKWVANNFLNWWRPLVEEAIGDAEIAATRVREELKSLGEWQNLKLGEAIHELIHVEDALAELREILGIENDSQETMDTR